MDGDSDDSLYSSMPVYTKGQTAGIAVGAAFGGLIVGVLATLAVLLYRKKRMVMEMNHELVAKKLIDEEKARTPSQTSLTTVCISK